MDIQKVAPELRPYYQYLPAIPFQNRSLKFLINLALRLAGRGRRLKGVKEEWHKIGEIKLRVYRPLEEPSGAAILWMHGGGFMVGSASQDQGICSVYARDLGLVVVSVDYRLAPEQPFPAALGDCLSAWNWMLDFAKELAINPNRIAIGGMSAGGGLAACLAQRLLDSGGTQPVAQLLIYPMLDDNTAANRELDMEMHPLWNNLNNRAGWKAYLGQNPGLPDVPEYAAAARRADLSGLPPAWIGVGDIDLFYKENGAYAERLISAGVPCVLDVVPEAPHGFQVVAPKTAISKSFQERSNRYVIKTLNLPQRPE